jgi:alpha-tubulin suppressor-like RCC1 family protein
MKSIRRVLLIGAGLILSVNLLHAQETTPADSTIVSLTAEAQGLTLLPADQVPGTGTFWWIMPQLGGATAFPMPGPPFDPSLPVYAITDQIFLVDDTIGSEPILSTPLSLRRGVSYTTETVLEAQAALVVNLIAQVQATAVAEAFGSPMTRMSMRAGSLAGSYAYGNAVYLVNMAASVAGDGSTTASFGIAGGTNFVPYNILMSTNVSAPISSWSWLGIGYPSNYYTFYEQPADVGFYILAKPSKTMTVGLGWDAVGQCDVPFGLTNALQVAGGYGQSLALKTDGTVVAWGGNLYGQGVVPTNLTGVSMISAGWYHDVALLTNGTVVAWGLNDPLYGYTMTNVPANLTNATVISAQALHTLALTSNGTVVAWGYNTSFGETNVPAGLSNVVAISAGFEFNLVVVTNGGGTVVAWGDNDDGETNVPAGLSNVVDVAAGFYHSLALLQNGTVVAWGSDDDGETDVPAGLTNVVAIAAGGYPNADDYSAYSLALKSDGTVVMWGDDLAAAPVAGLNNVIAIAAGAYHALAVRTGPPTPVITLEPTNQFQVVGGNATFTARGAGLYGVTYLWQTNGVNLSGATNATLTLTNVQAAQLGSYDVVVTDNDGMGSIVSSNVTFDFVTPPVIISQSPMPTNQVAAFETNLTLSVTATAPGQDNGFPLSYQWQFNGTNIAGATAAAYTFHVAATSFGTYSVLVSNAAGATNAAWQVSVYYPGILISQQPTNQYQIAGGSITFAGSGVASNTVTYQWAFAGTNITGATNASLTLTSVSAAQQGWYDFTVSDGIGSLTSSNAFFNLVTAPAINSATLPTNQFALYQSSLTLNVAASAPGQTNGFPLHYQWQFNGTNLSGQTSSNDTFTAVNSGIYSVIVTNAAGSTNTSWQVNVVYPGAVIPWGSDAYGQLNASLQLTNVISLAAGKAHGVVALDSGNVTNWGSFWTGTNFISAVAPPLLTNAIAVAAGSRHDLALKADGTIAAWGWDDFGQTNVPANATNVVAIAAGGQESLALLENGTVVQWGQTNAPVPAGLTNVTAVAAGTNFDLALLQNSTVVAWGMDDCGQTNIPAGLSNVVAIAAGGAHALALEQNGTVVAWGSWTNVPANLTNAMKVAAGENHSLALKNDGTVVAWGDDTFGQTNVIGGLNLMKLIAGGGDFSLAAQFSTTVMYPVDVPQDLLLIYNTNSTDSATVLNYFLQNRPMIGGANVLGIGCPGFYITNYPGDGTVVGVTNITDYETVSPSDFTNQVLNPVLNWLAANPTKRPQYVVAMLDVPSRISTLATNAANFPFYPDQVSITYPEFYSLSYQLATSVSAWQPFITHINMNGTNDCIAYINKVASFGINYSPGKLIISASAGAYGNTNWYFDDTEYTYGGDPIGLAGAQALIQDGVSSNSIAYTNIYPDCGSRACHIDSGNNVAGYFCWGSHSSLGVQFPLGGNQPWSGNSGWWIIETIESFNGERYRANQSNYVLWFLGTDFGGANYSNTPVGAISTTDEPDLGGNGNTSIYYPFWEKGKCFAICAWAARQSPYFQAVGDPFVTK